MIRKLALTALALALASPVFAATDATCSSAPASQFQPKSALTTKLNAEGLKVRTIKTENGCYEAYTVDAKGKKMTLGFNAKTLEPVSNAEAGEN